jgi:hypothetical protein
MYSNHWNDNYLQKDYTDLNTRLVETSTYFLNLTVQYGNLKNQTQADICANKAELALSFSSRSIRLVDRAEVIWIIKEYYEEIFRHYHALENFYFKEHRPNKAKDCKNKAEAAAIDACQMNLFLEQIAPSVHTAHSRNGSQYNQNGVSYHSFVNSANPNNLSISHAAFPFNFRYQKNNIHKKEGGTFHSNTPSFFNGYSHQDENSVEFQAMYRYKK